MRNHLSKAQSQGQPRSRGQGAIEYLLIIGAAILVVAIVVMAITSVLQQGQEQTTIGSDSAYDALHKLAVGGLGYNIELKLKDASSRDFPVPSNVDCKDPITKIRYACFYARTIAALSIDGNLVAQYDVTGLRSPQSYTYHFNGDPNTKHTLRIDYNDCYAGAQYGTGNDLKQIKTYLPGFNASNIETILTPRVITPQMTIFQPFWDWSNTSLDPDNNRSFAGSICNDGNLWDRNLDLNYIKIIRADGKELPVPLGIQWSTPLVNTEFQ